MFLRLAGLLVFLVYASALALGQGTEKYPATPAEVVRQYCEFDFKIGRISSENFEKQPPVTTWDEEPGWDGVEVVSSFKIVSSNQSEDRAVVTIKWQVLGEFSGEKVTAGQKEEVVEYQLKLVGGLWKIDSPVLSPHVSVATLRAFVLEKFPDDVHRQALIRSLDSLSDKKS
jgi:hypothetical protein